MTDDRPPEEGQAPTPLPARPQPAAPPQAPTPVRSLVGGDDAGARGDEAAPPPAPEPERSLEVDGTTWTVRATGRGRGGPREAPVPLLHLGFSRAGAEGAPPGPALEALVVGRRLEDFSEASLEEAFRVARPRPPADAVPKPFFAEITSKGNRGDG